jgi:hypothetical protein
VLKRADTFAAALRETGVRIPESLAAQRDLSRKLGSLEITGSDAAELRNRLAEVIAEREAAVRRRRAAAEGLLELKDAVDKARDGVTQSQPEFANSVIRDFNQRWTDACRALDVLRGEAAALSCALRVPVDCPAPYVATWSVSSARPQVVPVALAQQVEPTALPPALLMVGGVLDRLAAAAGLIAALVQAADLNSRHLALSRVRAGQQAEMTGTYEVVKAFHIFESNYAPGQLVDRSVMGGDGMVYRYWIARSLQPLESAIAA